MNQFTEPTDIDIYLLDTDTEMKEIDILYIHFDTFEECNILIDLLKCFDINITHKCCQGKGCGITKQNYTQAKNIYNNFKSENKIYKTIKSQDKKLECGICFHEVTSLTIKCYTGYHPYCSSCWDKLKKLECPTCRGPLL